MWSRAQWQLFLGLVGISTVLLVGIFWSRSSEITYRAQPSTAPTSSRPSLSPYEEYDQLLDSVSLSLDEATRREQERILGKRYLELSLSVCQAGDYLCGVGEVQFFDPFGCGCRPAQTPTSSIDVVAPATTTSLSTEQAATSTESTDVLVGGTLILGEPARMALEETWAIGRAGDVLWLEGFESGTGGEAPTPVYRLYVADSETTYTLPAEADQVFYMIETLATDYATYVESQVRLKNQSSE